MVEWKELGEFLDFQQPTKYLVKTTEYDDRYKTPVLTAGQSLILGYTDETEGIFEASIENPTIIFDDFTTSFHWVDFPFKAKSSAMKMLLPKEGTNFRYIYYAMLGINFIPSQHQRHWISKYSHFLIPIPPLAEQERIVGILDTFTAAIDNLKKQIAQRRKQYEFYRDQLLDTIETLKSVKQECVILKGTYITKKDTEHGDIPVILGGQEPAYFINKSNHEGKAIVISRSGASAGYVSFWNEPIFVTDGFLIEPKNNDLLMEFLYYSLKNKQSELQSLKRGAGVPHITTKHINEFIIPIPSLQEQRRIVSILDTFESAISNLEAQLAQRQKQYEYYRSQLLTFE